MTVVLVWLFKDCHFVLTVTVTVVIMWLWTYNHIPDWKPDSAEHVEIV